MRDSYTLTDFMGFLIPDVKRLEQLSLEDFAEYYFGEMRGYDYWKKGVKPKCFHCMEFIEKPEELRRYYGNNLHPECFSLVFIAEYEDMSKFDRRYFGLIERLRGFRPRQLDMFGVLSVI